MKYESMAIFKDVLTDDEIKKENEYILSLITELDGHIYNTDLWGRRDLAYSIKKIDRGYYVVNYFNLPEDKTVDLMRYYRFNENILRYNLITNN